MKLTRRQLLTIGGAAAASAVGGIALPRAARAEPMPPSVVPTLVKRISLYNLHTNEHLEPEFYRGAEYVPETFAAIQVFLRDFRNGEQHVIDPKLMDYRCSVSYPDTDRHEPMPCCMNAAAASPDTACISRVGPSMCGSPASIAPRSRPTLWI